VKTTNTRLSDACPFDGERVDNVMFATNDQFGAVYNVSPILPGHSLVIPRKHVERVFDLSDEELAGFVIFARRVTKLLLDVFHGRGFDWTIQDGEAAGQTVPHIHLHIIPRVDGDLHDPGDWYPRLELARQRSLSQSQLDSRDRSETTCDDRLVIVERLRSEAVRVGLWTE
jgi:bis(5'-adenosyl)-triphosphatase